MVFLGVGRVSESDMVGGGHDFLVSFVILQFGDEPLRFSVAVDGAVMKGSEIMGVVWVDFGVMVWELDSSFGRCFCLVLGIVKEWTSGRVVRVVHVTDGLLGLPGMASQDQARKVAHHVSVHLFWLLNLSHLMFGAKALVPKLPWCFT